MTEPNEDESEDRNSSAGHDEAPDTKETDSYTINETNNAPTFSDSPGDSDEGVPASPSVDTLSLYMRDIGAHSILTRDEEHELALAAREGNEEAFNKLVRSNLRYVVSVANRYKNFGLSLEDLINEGNIGLINAIKRFDPERGVKLITYAVWWIRQSIMHALADQRSTVRLPVKQAGLLHKISIMYEKLRQEFKREPTTYELSERLNIKVTDIEKLRRANRNYLSLDATISPDDDTSYLDLLEEQSAVSVEENVVQHSLEEEVEDLLAELDPRERDIIRMRYGFDGEAMTLEEIGSKLGLSRERIRQIEKKVISRFRAQGSNQTLHDFLS